MKKQISKPILGYITHFQGLLTSSSAFVGTSPPATARSATSEIGTSQICTRQNTQVYFTYTIITTNHLAFTSNEVRGVDGPPTSRRHYIGTSPTIYIKIIGKLHLSNGAWSIQAGVPGGPSSLLRPNSSHPDYVSK
jgi:hypothetical protein